MEVNNDIRMIAGELLQAYKDTIEKTGHAASHQLENSSTYRCTFDGRWFEISFNIQDYWKYLENGTRPHWPPISAIERWVVVKRIVPSTGSGRVPTTKQLAYMIARKISVKGTKATKLLQQTIDNADEIIDKLVESLFNQLKEEAEKDIDEAYENT